MELAVAVIPTPTICGGVGVPDCTVAGIWPWVAAAAATDAGTLEISAMKSSTIIRVLTLCCPVCVDDVLVLVLELLPEVVVLPFVLVPTEDRCSPNELEKVSLAAPLSALALILVPLVDVVDDDGCVLLVDEAPGCDTFDIMVVKDIPP